MSVLISLLLPVVCFQARAVLEREYGNLLAAGTERKLEEVSVSLLDKVLNMLVFPHSLVLKESDPRKRELTSAAACPSRMS